MPIRINRLPIQNLFHLDFVKQRASVAFISGTGLGKSHLMTTLGHAACLRGHSVLFTGATEIINTRAAAHATGSIKRAPCTATSSRRSSVSTNSATCPSTSSMPLPTRTNYNSCVNLTPDLPGQRN